ncbi:MAG: GNAT family N-acetyltransferase [Turicibacter sp.]|nr:GNAT family N-acetyltransferase [Turicibacter sp.]
MAELKFKNIRDFEKGTIFEILKQAWSFDERYYQADAETKWRNESDAFFFDHLSIADTCVFITTLNEEPIGVVMWDPRELPERATIGHNGIIPKYKGNGFGKLQLQEAINRILQAGAKKIEVSTNLDLIPARRMYESVGFKETRREPADNPVFDDWIFYAYQNL